VPTAGVLFLCTGNGSRSQMAQALLEQATGGGVRTVSAGSHPRRVHPNAVAAMAGRGIDISGRRAKHMDEFAGQPFAYVITLCDRVREVCPEFPGPHAPVHWSIPDPGAEEGTDEQTYPVFEAVASELTTRIEFFLHLLWPVPSSHEVT
jgi:ArsR family transcriptional regulator, arsenate/arsenite/antimonite-responsive transcriptional repressor / arsenate reductase (thioredoxin)